jgi:phage gp45-like
MWSDLFLASGAIINFNNGNLTLTHSSNALTLSGSDKLQFGDDATYIHQSEDSVLDLVSDGELELNATTEVEINTALVDVNASGAVTIDAGDDSNITVTGSLDVDASAALTIDSATSISIGTNEDKPINIDSTTLDIDASDAVTIDGTSISIDGNLNSNLTVTGSGQSLTLEATGGGTQQVVINSAGTSTSAVDINATAGGIDIDAFGALAINSATSISIGTNADKPVAIDSTTFDLDASSTVIIDGTGVSIDGTLDSNFTVDGSGQSLNLTVSGGGTQVFIFKFCRYRYKCNRYKCYWWWC